VSASVTLIYGIDQNGDLFVYKHAGINDGLNVWAYQNRKIGNGWDFRQVFASK
jgi:hypothetical protein